jgi:16S rRNA (uracil1498-N3)-methyltransferase
MPLRRIFSDQRLRSGASVTLGGDAAAHVLRVLRLRTGDALVIFDGTGTDYDAEITGLGREEVSVRVGAGREVRSESPLAVTLFQAVCRGPRMDAVIQKSTELGVARIEPVLTERSVVRLDPEQAGRKREHWLRVAIAAAEQSGRARVPEVGEARRLEDVLPETTGLATRLLLDPRGASLSSPGRNSSPVGLLVGPEGGLTEEESGMAADFGFTAVRLGPRILRTETAPVVAIALLQFLAGDLG